MNTRFYLSGAGLSTATVSTSIAYSSTTAVVGPPMPESGIHPPDGTQLDPIFGTGLALASVGVFIFARTRDTI